MIGYFRISDRVGLVFAAPDWGVGCGRDGSFYTCSLAVAGKLTAQPWPAWLFFMELSYLAVY